MVIVVWIFGGFLVLIFVLVTFTAFTSAVEEQQQIKQFKDHRTDQQKRNDEFRAAEEKKELISYLVELSDYGKSKTKKN